MKPVSNGKVVCCPKCGTCASVSEVSLGSFSCKNCATRFTGLVISGFVITFEDEGSPEDCLDRFENCKEKLKKLIELK